MQLDAFLPIIYDCPFPEFADLTQRTICASPRHSWEAKKMKKERTHAAEKPPLALGRILPPTPSQQRLEKLRAEANQYARMSESATDPVKREQFRRLAEQLALEVLELEQIVKEQDGP
jgi:hypothetical protein